MTTSSSHLLRITLLSGVAALGGFLFGYDSGVINGTVGALREAFDTDAVGSGFNVASMLLGCAAGAFLAGLSQWGTNFIVTMTFPLLLAGIGLGGAYSLYALFAVVSSFYAWKFVRETKGRSLEQMEL